MSPDSCRVCNERAHGMHFGVLSCRACAAFFRRTVALDLNYGCRERSHNCEVKKEPIGVMCRACRFRKCLALGMDKNGVQLSHEFEHKAQKRAKLHRAKRNAAKQSDPPVEDPGPPDIIVAMPESLHALFAPKPEYNSYRKHIDCARDAFCYFETKWHESMNESQRATCALGRPFDYKLETTAAFFEKPENVALVRTQMLLIGELLARLRGFHDLGDDQKFAVFKAFWPRFSILNSLRISYPWEYEKYEEIKDRLQFERVAPTSEERMERHHLNALVIPMARLEPDEVEFAAMIVLTLWNLEGNFENLSGVTQPTIEAGRTYKAELFDELHDYYTEKEASASYALRVATLSSIVHSVDAVCQQRSEDINVLRTFGLLKGPVSTEELLKDIAEVSEP